jgi:pyruvate ferredoxin oxidoreductase delta subunit
MKWETEDIQKWPPEKHELGHFIPEAGNACYYSTGGWRSERPVRDEEKCTQCLFCYFYCPDSSVIVEDQKVVAFDLDHCKGCGICAAECPADAITMHLETDFHDDGGEE